MATRNPNGASSIYKGADGDWHGRVTVGVRDDGKPDRRHIQRKTKNDVIAAVRKLERDRYAGTVKKAGQRWTVESWLSHWLDTIAAPTVSENTLSGYSVAVNTHLIPGLGKHRLDKLAPEHLERLYAQMMKKGSAAATAHQAHRTIRTALNHAARRGYIGRNPATVAKPPRIPEHEIEPYSIDEVRRLLEVAATRPNGARWALALALGLRQGEALGLQWSDVDLSAGTIAIRRSRQRPRWRHGCKGKCGRTKAGYCPQREPARKETAQTKSSAGRRQIGLPDELATLLAAHREEQDRQKEAAGQLWQERGWVFAGPTGGPLNPSTDYHEWKRLLGLAGLRDGRLHDARHTAATVLLILGVPERAVMSLMGWSNTAMAIRYQHLTAQIRRDIAQQINGLIWLPDAQPGTVGEAGSEGSSLSA